MILKQNSDDYYKYCRETRKNNDEILFFNGCFDIIHLGHIKMINNIQNQYTGFKIVCGLNSDVSARLQNKSHPLIHDFKYRQMVVDNLFNKMSVDFIEFDTPTPCSIIWHLMPDILIKGQDYKDKSFPEKLIMDKIGGVINYYTSGIEMSTTTIIERIKSYDKIKTEI